ncbi:MAG: hypothetical protein IJ778_04595 [Alphaproteobacteria bacterium]|nr:hypothetical protein [Alphaproteobacteria bacterium]
MKFVLALIRAFGIVLSICLFCAFMYYTFIDQHEAENGKMLSYGSLLLFVLSTVITSLVSVGFENYQNKKQDSALINRIIDKMQSLTLPAVTSGEVVAPDIAPLADMLTENNNIAAETLRQGLESINQRLSDLPSDNFSKKVDFGIESLNNRLTEIQETLSAKNQMPDFTEMTAVSEKLMQFGQDFESIKNQMTRNLNEISQELSVLKKQQKNYDDALKDISSKLDYLLPLMHNVMQKNMLSQRGFTDFSEEKNDVEAEEFDNSKNIKDTENILPSEDNDEKQTDVVSEEKEVSEDKHEAVAEEIAEIKSEPEVIAEEVSENELESSDSIDLNKYLSNEDIEAVSLETQENTSDNDKVLADTPEYVAENPFGAPVKNSTGKHLPKIEAGIDPSLYSSDTPFGAENVGSTDDMPDLPPPTNPAMLESDNPYGVVSENADYEVPTESGSLEADNPFGAPVDIADSYDEKMKDKTQLKEIFNDKFAEEMAALDILKDDDETASSKSADEAYEEIDLNELLGGNK